MNESDQILGIVGHQAMSRLVAQYGGQKVYIPKHMPVPGRDERIIRIFSDALNDGSTCRNAYKQAASQEGLSVRHVQRIVAAS